jgi:hypothetical protein
MLKLYDSYSYCLSGDELTIFVKDFAGNEFSVATISDVNDENAEDITKETLADLEYHFKDEYDFSNIEEGHTREEYKKYFNDEYEDGTLWDFSIEELFDGSLEKNSHIIYWLIGNNAYETSIQNTKEDKEKWQKILTKED